MNKKNLIRLLNIYGKNGNKIIEKQLKFIIHNIFQEEIDRNNIDLSDESDVADVLKRRLDFSDEQIKEYFEKYE